MLLKNLNKLGLLIVLSLIVSCSEDDSINEPGNGTGENTTTVYLTDAPIDDAYVEAVFITVSEVRVNGKAIEGYNTSTIQVSSLTNGNTELLGQLDLEAGTTSDIALVLSETDATGNGPGNYVLTSAGSKQEISGALEINLRDQVEIIESAQNEIVLDFDLRKTIKSEGENYSFVSESQLENSIRAVNTINTGVVKGNVDNISETDGTIVAYAYSSGTFSGSENNPNAEGVRFSNAVSSAVVSENGGNFEIHFLEEGEYELHFASYSDNDQDGKLELSGLVEANTASSIDLGSVQVEANSETNLEVSFAGLLGL